MILQHDNVVKVFETYLETLIWYVKLRPPYSPGVAISWFEQWHAAEVTDNVGL